MISAQRSQASLIYFLPSLGIFLFTVLYSIAAYLYPGGSQLDSSSTGFDWVHNYLCNLLSITAVNGLPNPGRPYAIGALFLICMAMIAFFWSFAKVIAQNEQRKKIIRITSTLGFVTIVGLFTQWHDLATIISSVFGIVLILNVVLELQQTQLKSFRTSAYCCLLLLLVNNMIYYSGIGIYYLPLLQKVSMVVCFVWVWKMNANIRSLTV